MTHMCGKMTHVCGKMTHITSKELTIPYLLAANAVDKNPAWASQGTRPKTVGNMIFFAAPAGRKFLSTAQFFD